MAIDGRLKRQAIESLSSVPGVFMHPASLVEDVYLLAYAFPEEQAFKAACANTRRALEHLVDGAVTPSDLRHDFQGWKPCHYRHAVGQGTRATCRIMCRNVPGGIEVKGFGHRRIPEDFYERMRQAARP